MLRLRPSPRSAISDLEYASRSHAPDSFIRNLVISVAASGRRCRSFRLLSTRFVCRRWLHLCVARHSHAPCIQPRCDLRNRVTPDFGRVSPYAYSMLSWPKGHEAVAREHFLHRSVHALNVYRRLASMPAWAFAPGAARYDHGFLLGDPVGRVYCPLHALALLLAKRFLGSEVDRDVPSTGRESLLKIKQRNKDASRLPAFVQSFDACCHASDRCDDSSPRPRPIFTRTEETRAPGSIFRGRYHAIGKCRFADGD